MFLWKRGRLNQHHIVILVEFSTLEYGRWWGKIDSTEHQNKWQRAMWQTEMSCNFCSGVLDLILVCTVWRSTSGDLLHWSHKHGSEVSSHLTGTVGPGLTDQKYKNKKWNQVIINDDYFTLPRQEAGFEVIGIGIMDSSNVLCDVFFLVFSRPQNDWNPLFTQSNFMLQAEWPLVNHHGKRSHLSEEKQIFLRNMDFMKMWNILWQFNFKLLNLKNYKPPLF